jgi:uncharacterized protein YidB (DUF937 family)
MDLSSIMKMASNPQIRNLVMSLLGQMGGKGSGANMGGANMAGLLDNMKASGLDDQVKSWVGTGENQPVTADQVTQAIGADKLQAAAKQAGCSPQQAADDLAKVLPQMVDTATPTGKAPTANDFNALFQKFMGSSDPKGVSQPKM